METGPRSCENSARGAHSLSASTPYGGQFTSGGKFMSSVNAAAHAIASKEVKAQGRGKRPQWQAGQPIRKAEESNTDKPPWGERGRGRGRAEPAGVGGGGGRTMYRGSIRVADRTTGRRRLCLAGWQDDTIAKPSPPAPPGVNFRFKRPGSHF